MFGSRRRQGAHRSNPQNIATTNVGTSRQYGGSRADQDVPNSEVAMSNAAQDGADRYLSSEMVTGIANILGMRPPRMMDAGVQEENKLLHYNLQSAQEYRDAQHLLHENKLLRHENRRLQEALELSLEAMEVKRRAASEAEQSEVSNITAEIQDGADPPKADQDPHSDSDATTTNLAAQDGAGLASGMLGMRPPATKEQRLVVENHRLKEEMKNLRTDYRIADSAARKYYQETYRLTHDNQRLVETLEAISLELKDVTKRYEETKALSETRGKELMGTQVFLTKADALSISEVIQKVDGLNDEIFRAAASLGETIVQKKFEARCSPEEKATAEALLKLPLYRALRIRARKPEEGIHPLLVQITLQAFLAAFCFNRIRSWTSSNLALDITLREIYAKIWSLSDPAVSGRWRALTRAQLRPDTNKWIEELMSDLDTILAVASWELSSPKDKHTLEARLPAIFRVVLDVRESIGEKFTSTDIEVAFVEPHIPFNSVYMEEAYPADSEVGHEKETEIVITTVGMGLYKVVPLHGSRGYEYALAPKVVLESSLKKAFGPQPSRPTQSKLVRP